MLAIAGTTLFALALLISIPNSSAQSESTTIIPIDNEISIEKTVTTMSVPENNTLPWGHVKGKIADPVERYPVIIQFFKGEDPVHFAQVDVKGDDTYEYVFRVRSVDGDNVINIFEGDYTVKIFKVVHTNINPI